MNKELFSKYRAKYRDALLDDCIPFWLKNGMDREYGGMATYLDRYGNAMSTIRAVG